MTKPLVIKSPLKSWPGKIELPDPDDFSGIHWQSWKAGINKPSRKSSAMVHVYCYAGLELIEAAGVWDVSDSDGEALPLADVQAWEKAPEDERIKLVAWLGRSVMGYMDGIMDPKG